MRFLTGILLIAPLIAAIPAPTPAPAPYTTAVAIYARQTTTPLIPPIVPPPDDEEEEEPPASSSSSSSSARPSSSSSTVPPSSSSSQEESSSSTQPPSSSTSTRRLSTSSTEVISTSRDSEGNEQVVTFTRVETVVAPSESPSQSSKPKEPESTGISTSGIIGLSVAGGVAVLAVIGFIVWKVTSKRFSHFDDDDAPINWDKEPAVVVAPTRPAPSIMTSNTAASSVDLSRDPYAVPPLPQNSGYKDDSGFYDPYRGPVPGTFATPPASTDGHGQWHAGGEAIQMNTYPTRTTSPGPNLAYKDPYAGSVRSTSPGPNLAYGDPMNRTGTPVQRLGTPGYGLPGDISRTGTPAAGYGQAGFGHDINRMGTPGAQSAYGHDINRMGTPGGVPGYRGQSPGPNMAYGGQNPYAGHH